MAANDWTDPKWIGHRFGHLVVTAHAGKGKLLCRCDCGREVAVKGYHLINKYQSTCGRDCSYHKEVISDGPTKHGMSRDRLYNIWNGMRQRCYNPKNNNFPRYGGCGITICDEWKDDIFAFRDWALSNGYSDDLSIDRIDPNKGYSPDNCRWATVKEQNSHLQPRGTFTPKSKIKHKPRKTWVIDVIEKSIQEWCDEYGLTVQAVLYRVNSKGMTPKEALATPKQQGVLLDQVEVTNKN